MGRTIAAIEAGYAPGERDLRGGRLMPRSGRRIRHAGRQIASTGRRPSLPSLVAAALAAAAVAPGIARAEAPPQAQAMEEDYAEAIREFTTEERFLSDLVDHLPDHPAVPSPLDHFGTIVGAPGILHYTEEIHGYLRALDEASPRVRLWVIGESDGGREMVAVAVADSATIANIDRYRDLLRRLSDPREISAEEAESLIAEAKPIYFATMGLHSTESGPPEMAMEIAYRLAVEESPLVQRIRRNVIFVFTPVVEADGRDRTVDWYFREKEWKAAHGISDSLEVPGFPGAPYWGKYVAHDNNRDGLQLSQTLTQVMMEAYLEWRPTIFHDLHQSIPLLYVSTGTGPYNEYLDPIVVSEWNQIAYHEISGMTRRGMPGVWTHGFYTGWSPTYLFYFANLRNGIGRFYETFGGDADTEWESIDDASEVEWYRPTPAPDTVLWSLRNNTNYMETALLLALGYTADNGETLLRNSYVKAKRQVERGRSESPHAYIIPAEQPRELEAVKLVNLLRRHGVEVHRLGAPVNVRVAAPERDTSAAGDTAGGAAGMAADTAAADIAAPDTAAADAADRRPPDTPGGAGPPGDEADRDTSAMRAFDAGDYVVRLDQPYRVVVLQILGIQHFPEDAGIPYDDTGWTLSLLRNVEAVAVADSSILGAPMERLESNARFTGVYDRSAGGDGGAGGEGDEGGQPAEVYALPYATQNEAIGFRLTLADVPMQAAEDSFRLAGRSFGPGTILIPADEIGFDELRETAAAHGLDVHGLTAAPDVPLHELDVPRVAFVHTWIFTQNSGWVRHAFDMYGIPYDYISGQDVREMEDLRSRYDVIVFPYASGDSRTIVRGILPLEDPVAWERTDRYRHIGVLDETADMAGGMGFTGLEDLRRFVSAGGLLITTGSTSEMLVDFGVVPDVRVRDAEDLQAPGVIVRAQVDSSSARSPLLYGYWPAVRDSLPVYFRQGPVLEVIGTEDETDRRRFPRTLPASRPILRFAKEDELLLSGGLRGGEALAERAAVVDARLGDGHILLFAMRPFWRWESQGSMPLVFNALLNWNDLDAAWAEPQGEAGVAAGSAVN